MSYPVYTVPAGDVLPILFSTYDGGTGASLTMSGLAVTDIEIYKDGSTTQRASDAGYTLLDTDGIDFDGTTGIHGFSIDTGDNTDAGFYTVGAWFHVVVSAVTVDAQTVSFIAAAFRIVAAESVAGKPKVDVDTFGGSAGTFSSGRPEVNATHLAGTAYGSADFSATMKASINTEADTALSDYGALKPTTAGRTLDVTATGAAGIDWGNVENPTTVVDLSATTIDTDQAVASVAGAVGSVTGNVGGNVTGSVGSVAAGGITASSIAADAIGASELAADAAAEIASAVRTELATELGRVDAAITTRLASADITLSGGAVTVGTNNDKTGYAVGAGGIDATAFAAGAIDASALAANAIGASELAQDAAREIADEVLDRDIAGGASGGSRNVRNALRRLRNRVRINGGTATVYQEDDATSAWTAAVTTTAGDPVSEVDPA